MAAGATLVRRFWALYQARRWAEAEALLAPAAQCLWWATRERFVGAAAIVHVNAVYPEGWTIHLLELNALAPAEGRERIHSLVRVEQDGRSFYANSFFVIDGAQIVAIDEYWSDQQPAPAWRTPEQLPGMAWLTDDARPGLDLSLGGA